MAFVTSWTEDSCRAGWFLTYIYICIDIDIFIHHGLCMTEAVQ